MKNRIIALGLIFAVSGSIIAPTAAMANENAAKNAAIGATALSAYLLMHHKTRTAGWIGAAGSAYLWKKYSDSRSSRRRREVAREYRARRNAAYWRSRYYASHRTATRRARYARSYRAR